MKSDYPLGTLCVVLVSLLILGACKKDINMKVHHLKISRFAPPPPQVSNQRATQILKDGTEVLQTNDGPGDVSCKVKFQRDGAVVTFTFGDGEIDSGAEFNTVLALPGYVKVVREINWCGGLVPNVIGCAPVPGDSLVVVRFTPSLEGILWDHEYGHNKGLSHRNDPNAVMNPAIGPTHRRVTSTECTAFRE